MGGSYSASPLGVDGVVSPVSLIGFVEFFNDISVTVDEVFGSGIQSS